MTYAQIFSLHCKSSNVCRKIMKNTIYVEMHIQSLTLSFPNVKLRFLFNYLQIKICGALMTEQYRAY